MIRAGPQALGGRWLGDVDMVIGDSIKHEVDLEIFWRQKKVNWGHCYR